MIRHSAAFLCLHTCYRMFLTRSISPEHAPSLPWPPCSLLCYGILARKTLGSSYPDSHLGTLVRVLQCVGAWAWILKNKVEQEGQPTPQAGPATHTSMLELKARFTLALIFTTWPTLRRGKQEVSLPEGPREDRHLRCPHLRRDQGRTGTSDAHTSARDQGRDRSLRHPHLSEGRRSGKSTSKFPEHSHTIAMSPSQQTCSIESELP